MISSRRLAREWALKILYQVDVGRVSAEEAERSAMETLRREFVQRGSRSASGSESEAVWLECVTASLRDTLPTLRLPMERACALSAGRSCDDAPYWLETHIEKALKRIAPGIVWSPAHLGALHPQSVFFPPEDTTDALATQVHRLNEEERERYRRFVLEAQEQLPALFEKEFRNEGKLFAKALATERPIGSNAEVLAYVQERREAYHQEQATRWRKIGAITQKQTSDWLRTAAFVMKLTRGTLAQRAEIDREIERLAAGWRLERQAAVDRNILRLAGMEILTLESVPTAATINEAVELAKKYSSAESGRFVNGVLGALATQFGAKTASPDAPQDAIESEEREELLDLPDIASVEENEESE